MATQQLTERKFSKEEYFTRLAASEQKLEYDDGIIHAMAGASGNHNRIKMDTGVYLGSRLNNSCQPFDSDMAVSVPAVNSYFFPDLSFVCDEEDKYENEIQSFLLNPSLIIEVLSPGTELRDRSHKSKAYWKIPILKEYVLIASLEVRVDVIHRAGDNFWHMRSYYDLDEIVSLRSLDLDIPMAEIYKRARF